MDKYEEMLAEANEIKENINNENSIEVFSESKNAIGFNTSVEETLGNVKSKILSNAEDKINDEKIIEKHSKKLAENADEAIAVELDKQSLENEKKKADNKATKKEIKNRLFVLKQEAKRLKKEQRHLNILQKQEQKKESDKTYWQNHGDTLAQYKMHEGSNRIFCEILLWLDGIKGFINGLGSLSTAIINALKWIILGGLAFIVIMIIPNLREWFLTLLGF